MSRLFPLFLSVLFATPAMADTCIISNASRCQLNSDAVEWAMQIVSGRSCIRGLNFGSVIVDDVKLVSPPQSGKVALVGPGFSYTAKSNFQGQRLHPAGFGLHGPHPRTSEIKVLVSVGSP
jgi:hypothetical protein